MSESDFERAGQAADLAYHRLMLRKSLVMLAASSCFLAVLAADASFALASLWLLPQFPAGLLLGFMCGEAAVAGHGVLRRRRENRARKQTEGEQAAEFIDSMWKIRESPGRPAWRDGPKAKRFWYWLALRAVYSGCAVLVLAHLAGLPAGIALAAVYTAAVMGLGVWSVRVIDGVARAVTFADPRRARDTPET